MWNFCTASATVGSPQFIARSFNRKSTVLEADVNKLRPPPQKNELPHLQKAAPVIFLAGDPADYICNPSLNLRISLCWKPKSPYKLGTGLQIRLIPNPIIFVTKKYRYPPKLTIFGQPTFKGERPTFWGPPVLVMNSFRAAASLDGKNRPI